MIVSRWQKFWKRLKLGSKFTLSLSLVFLCGSLLGYIVLYQMQTNTAKQTVDQQAIVVMDTLNALRNYHANQIRPMMDVSTDETSEFLPETVPSYVVRQIFEQFRQQEGFQQYLYKDATLNPTNPRDRSDIFETQFIAQFKDDANVQELEGFRRLNGEPLFYVARPLSVTQSSCLGCHSTPEAAPKNLIEQYGSEGGFGWHLNEIIAAQIIYVPARHIFQIARQNTRLAVILFMAIFALVLLILNSLLKRTVIVPLQPMSKIARYLSDDTSQSDSQSVQKYDREFQQLNEVTYRGDELGQLACIFQRMSKVVFHRERGLRQQLQDALDGIEQKEQDLQDKKQYIQKLLARSRAIRGYVCGVGAERNNN